MADKKKKGGASKGEKKADGTKTTAKPEGKKKASKGKAKTILEVVDIEGKGRGFRALEDIPAFTLLLVDTPVVTSYPADSSEIPEEAIQELIKQISEKKIKLNLSYDSAKLPKLKSPVTGVTDEEYSILTAQIKANCFVENVGVESHQVALFPKISLFNHSCSPNAVISPKQSSVYSLVDIKKGDEVCIAYREKDLILPHELRSEKLQQSHGFKCLCIRCSTPEIDRPLLQGDSSFKPANLLLLEIDYNGLAKDYQEYSDIKSCMTFLKKVNLFLAKYPQLGPTHWRRFILRDWIIDSFGSIVRNGTTKQREQAGKQIDSWALEQMKALEALKDIFPSETPGKLALYNSCLTAPGGKIPEERKEEYEKLTSLYG